jgi:alkanesulfonate monooxygenase SsuD/methylene tetrahydromethanopterin reductase-like flavin-dependent oxidoreductase (luciferase family)
MGGISPIVLSWISREEKRARIKALKDGADSAGRDPHQTDDMRVRARLLEAKAELERIDAPRVR